MRSEGAKLVPLSLQTWSSERRFLEPVKYPGYLNSLDDGCLAGVRFLSGPAGCFYLAPARSGDCLILEVFLNWGESATSP